MTSAQRERLQTLLDDIRHLVSDIEEDARDRGFEGGYEVGYEKGFDDAGGKSETQGGI
jgi:hypothetical protein